MSRCCTALLSTVLCLSGCAPSIGKVSGQVMFDGKPLPGGRVTFRPADPGANATSAELDEEGRFSVTLPCGDVTVSVDNRELAPRTRGPAPNVPVNIPPELQGKFSPRGGGRGSTTTPGSPRYREIPGKYYNGDTSGLKFTVKTGEQTETVTLTGQP